MCWYVVPGKTVGIRLHTPLGKKSEKIETELVPVTLFVLQVYSLDEVKIQKIPARDASLLSY